MRTSLLVLSAVVALVVSGCDSTGVDPTDPGTQPPTQPPAGILTFASVNPQATYLRTDPNTPGAVPYRLADFGLQGGDRVCFTARGDYFAVPGVRASSTGGPLATGVFSASTTLTAGSDLNRATDALGGTWSIATGPRSTDGAPTDITQDFDATNACYTVPTGARYVFFSVVDGYFVDNADAMANNRPFGIHFVEQ